MATAAQIQANQHNAQLSTGPRTAEGKARSAANSTRHGFCSQSVLLPGDDPALGRPHRCCCRCDRHARFLGRCSGPLC